MANPNREIAVNVKLNVPTEAVERLAAAQERFNASLKEMQEAIREVQMATYQLAESVGTVAEEPEPEVVKEDVPPQADEAATPPTPQEN